MSSLAIMRQSSPIYDCSTMEELSSPFSQAAVDDLCSRQQQTRWREIVIGAGPSLGVNRDSWRSFLRVGSLRALTAYWARIDLLFTRRVVIRGIDDSGGMLQGFVNVNAFLIPLGYY